MSRLGQMIGNADKAFDALKKQDALEEQIEDAGSAFELAARAALGAWEARGGMRPLQHVPNNAYDEAYTREQLFEMGYQTAAGELAVVLRAMRHGRIPDRAELDLIQDEVEKAFA